MNQPERNEAENKQPTEVEPSNESKDQLEEVFRDS